MAEILVVDDDDVIRETLCELLSQDHRCQAANTAEEALTKLESQPFEVVLTDISMSGLSGLDLLNRVVQLYPGTPVIIRSEERRVGKECRSRCAPQQYITEGKMT